MDGGEQEEQPQVEVRRSARRKRTVSAYEEGGRTIVLIPDRFTAAEEAQWVSQMLGRLAARRHRTPRDDQELQERARELSRLHLGGLAKPTSVTWVGNQTTRWGSCTPASGTIRISTRLQQMPSWVLDYVLVHELAHLLAPGHGKDFWALVRSYPRTERARGYLEGFVHAERGVVSPDDEPSGEGLEDDVEDS